MNNFRIMFLRDGNGQPVGCVSMISVDTGYVAYQVSTLNPADRFNRKLARQLAMGRTMEAPRQVKVALDANMHEVYRAVMSDIANSKSFPDRSVKAARRWLKKVSK